MGLHDDKPNKPAAENQAVAKTETVQSLFKKVDIQKKFDEMLGSRAPQFISSVIQTISNNKALAKCKPETVLNAAAMAASLDLPINHNLGFAWIIPYGDEAQFQMGAKGFVQLALRTSEYSAMNHVVVYENQFNSFNSLTEKLDADFSIDGEGKVVGYASFFALHNGFKKTVFWSMKKIKKHAKKYSKTYEKKNRAGNLMKSPWNDPDQFDSMGLKTVTKSNISKWGPMSVQMQRAHVADQAVIHDEITLDVEYVDATEEDVEAKKKELRDKKTKADDLP